LYTRAVATSIVCGKDSQPSNSVVVEKKRRKTNRSFSKQYVQRRAFLEIFFLSQATTYRHLLAQEIEVFFAVAQTLFRGAELVCKELFGFGDGVGEHDVGLSVIIVSQWFLWIVSGDL